MAGAPRVREEAPAWSACLHLWEVVLPVVAVPRGVSLLAHLVGGRQYLRLALGVVPLVPLYSEARMVECVRAEYEPKPELSLVVASPSAFSLAIPLPVSISTTVACT